jgi:transcriptional regulator GlxA family with amidase domain
MIIAFYLQDGVEVLDFAGPMEVFDYAGFKIFTVGKTNAPILSQRILKITPDYSIDNAPQADILAFFGGNGVPASKDPQVLDWLRKQAPKAQLLFSVCTGAYFLGRAGLLDGLTATTFHDNVEDLRSILPKTKVLANTRFVDNGHVITTAGISAGIDGALHLVARLKGDAEAQRIAKEMEYDKWIPNEGVITGQ